MNQINEELYRTMYLIRACEEKIIKHYHENEMKTPVHLGIGAEAIYAGVIYALATTDHIFGTYRNHGIYLARTGDTDAFFGELLGRECGQFSGKGGSMHLFSPKHGFMASSAIVGSTIPLAVGCAYSNKLQGNDKWVASFFGDGAMEEGVFWESINFAMLHDLQIMFICEDNGLAIHTHRRDRMTKDMARAIPLPTYCVAKSAEGIYNKVRLAMKIGIPSFHNYEYTRMYEHCGVNEDWDVGYREKPKDWYDPLLLQAENLSQYAIHDIETEVNRQIEDSWNKAKKSPTVMQ